MHGPLSSSRPGIQAGLPPREKGRAAPDTKNIPESSRSPFLSFSVYFCRPSRVQEGEGRSTREEPEGFLHQGVNSHHQSSLTARDHPADAVTGEDGLRVVAVGQQVVETVLGKEKAREPEPAEKLCWVLYPHLNSL